MANNSFSEDSLESFAKLTMLALDLKAYIEDSKNQQKIITSGEDKTGNLLGYSLMLFSLS